MKGIVSEIYSTPRVTAMIKMMPSSEVLAGFALDLTTCDTYGRAWNFDEAEMRTRARKKFDTEHITINQRFCDAHASYIKKCAGNSAFSTRV